MTDQVAERVPPKIAAVMLGRSVRWLCEARRITRRGRSYGPSWVKLGGRILYRLEELESWQERGRGL